MTSEGLVLRLVVPGYVPPSQNALRGRHWSVLAREKHRAGLALINAIRLHLESTPEDQMIGTTSPSSKFRIAASRLDSYLTITGAYSKAKSSLVRFTHKRKREPKSK